MGQQRLKARNNSLIGAVTCHERDLCRCPAAAYNGVLLLYQPSLR